jgi:DNA-binding NtrC family response regulator
MVCAASKLSDYNVLASQTDWAWPRALGDIFQPRGVNLIVAGAAGEFVNVLEHQRVHATIVDADSHLGGLATLRLIRMDFPRLPCLMLSSRSGQDLLGQALDLDVFSVIDKPVDMHVLQQQLNRLFVKKYDSDIFA